MEIEPVDIDSHIEAIARALADRDGRGGGRATAMIGAGFSRNAGPRTRNASKFPFWRDIMRPLMDELLPPCSQCGWSNGKPCPNDRYSARCEMRSRRYALFDDAAGASGMMALGDKFEAKAGKARLRAALEKAIPDRDHEPGRAHQLLVRLPWADIFTTNWDTLLERAVDDYDRSYDTVITIDQIASTSSPRIVKLHGCVRSGTRLIFTEEDFRTYPINYAPFVSLVQQSLMENVVVLFGFSGSDPNFRAWHGWVRDHLGRNTQPLYLVTVRPVDPIDVNYMGGRLINHIDLTRKWKSASPEETVEAFLEAIDKRVRELRPNLDWPVDRSMTRIGGSSRSASPGPGNWTARFGQYPGWLVAPGPNRINLMAEMDEKLRAAQTTPELDEKGEASALLSGFEDLFRTVPSPDVKGRPTRREEAAVMVASALNIALARPAKQLRDLLLQVLAGALRRLIAEVDNAHSATTAGTADLVAVSSFLAARFPAAMQVIDEAERADVLASAKIETTDTISKAIAPLLPLIEVVEREARFAGDNDTATTLRSVIWAFGGKGPGRELVSRSAVQAALARLDLQQIATFHSLWPNRSDEAAMRLCRADTRREIGEIQDAYDEVSATVGHLRSLGSARRRGVEERSREAWALFIYADLLEANPELNRHFPTRQGSLSFDDVVDELKDRLDELETSRCDPRREVTGLRQDLDSETEKTFLHRLLKNASVPIAADRPRSGSTEPLTPRYLRADPASTFLILCETVGLPITHISGGNRLALSAARLLAPDHRELAIALVLRAGTPEDLPFTPVEDGDGSADWLVANVVFDIARRAEDFALVTGIVERLIAPLRDYGTGTVSPAWLDRKLRLLQHLVASFVARSEPSVAKRLAPDALVLACRILCSPTVAATEAGWSNLLAIFEAALRHLPGDRIAPHEVLTTLLDLPLAPKDSIAECWPDPFRLLVAVWPVAPGACGPGDGAPENDYAAELRHEGARLVERMRLALSDDPGLRLGLAERRHGFERLENRNDGEHRLIVVRRRILLDDILHTESDAPAT